MQLLFPVFQDLQYYIKPVFLNSPNFAYSLRMILLFSAQSFKEIAPETSHLCLIWAEEGKTLQETLGQSWAQMKTSPLSKDSTGYQDPAVLEKTLTCFQSQSR